MSISVLAMPVTSPDGATHPDAIYLPGTVTMDNLDQQGGVEWVAYHSPAAYLAGATPIAGTEHHTALDRTLYAGVVAFPLPAGATTYGQVTAAALVFLAQNVLDTDSGQKDASGQPVLVSFFANATVQTIG